MKVGTDSLLLGSWVTIKKPSTILDIGTGSGILALMMAQRAQSATVDAIEIDSEAADQSSDNVLYSPWSDRVLVQNMSLQSYKERTRKRYDLIISNPPFFEAGTGMKSGNSQRQQARHTDSLSYEDLLDGAAQLLAPNGRFALVLPFASGALFLELAAVCGLFPVRYTAVRPFADRAPNRLLLELMQEAHPSSENDEIVIRESHQHYSEQYRELTSPFYLANRLK